MSSVKISWPAADGMVPLPASTIGSTSPAPARCRRAPGLPAMPPLPGCRRCRAGDAADPGAFAAGSSPPIAAGAGDAALAAVVPLAPMIHAPFRTVQRAARACVGTGFDLLDIGVAQTGAVDRHRDPGSIASAGETSDARTTGVPERKADFTAGTFAGAGTHATANRRRYSDCRSSCPARSVHLMVAIVPSANAPAAPLNRRRECRSILRRTSPLRLLQTLPRASRTVAAVELVALKAPPEHAADRARGERAGAREPPRCPRRLRAVCARFAGEPDVGSR